ncbi:MAG: DUF2723 domain-containing protein [Sedimentisphaerales bacterium]|nr:DUF2723 domain-containing protein [Sedimentisphaerales bacterium]
MPKNDSYLKTSYIFIFLVTALLYTATCAPTVVWQDSGLIQYRTWQNDIEGRLGLALSHPLYYLLAIAAKHVPIGEFAYRINVLTALIAALAVANLYLLLRLWLGRIFPALLGAATLALSHTFWSHATIPETYGLAIALLLFELIALLQYAKTSRTGYLYLLALFNGLAIANHMLASIAFVCYFVLVVVLLKNRQIKWRNLLFMAILWIAGALPYEYLIIKNIAQNGDFLGTLASAAFGQRWQANVLNTTLNMQIIKENFMYILLNFPTPNLLLLIVGALSVREISPKRWFANVLIALMIMYFVFAFRYTVPDRYAFFIPFYCIVSILIGVGASSYLHRRNEIIVYFFAAFCLVVVPVYYISPKIAQGLEIKIGSGRKIFYRNDDTYFLWPWKTRYKGAEQFALDALFIVEPPAVIYADATTAPPLLYAQKIMKKRPDADIKIISSIGTTENAPVLNELTIEKLLSEGNVFVVTPAKNYCPDFLLMRYDFEPFGVLWKVVKKPDL